MIPAAPPGAVRFNPPPAWRAPEGFDPRRGHLPDPAWPAVEPSWQFWVPDAEAGRDRPVLPSATLPRGRMAPDERRRLVLVLTGLVVVGCLVVWGVVASGGTTDSVPTGVGSCWSGVEGGDMEAVSCDSGQATHMIESRVSDPELCPMTSNGYFEDGNAYLCVKRLG